MAPASSIVARVIVAADHKENGTVIISVPPGRRQRKNSARAVG